MRGFRNPPLAVCILLAAVALQSCGTAHHFVPREPLEKRQWELSLTWHYDLNALDAPNFIPDFNAYLGLGNRQNIGMGTNFPFLVSHLTYANYQPEINDSRWAFYVHLNQIYAFQRNPYFEIGSMYYKSSDHSNELGQAFLFGLAYGRTSHLRPLVPDNGMTLEKSITKYSAIMPVLKYRLESNEVALSIVHYFGATNNAYSPLRDSISKKNDTLVTIISKNVDTVFSVDHFISVQLVDGSTIQFKRPFLCGFGFFGNLRTHPMDIRRGYNNYYVTSEKNGEQFTRYLELNSNQLKKDIMNSDIVYVTEYPLQLLEELNFAKSLLWDNSIGVIYFGRSK